MHNLFKLITVVLILSLFCSCSEDRIIQNEPPDPPSPYKDLKEKDDILFNLELAYNERDIGEFDKMLAQEFLFYFAWEDYLAGYTPEKWNRASEIVATDRVFNIPEDSTAGHYSNFSEAPRRIDTGMENVTWGMLKALEAPAKSLNLNLAFYEGDSTWAVYTPPDTSSFAGEAWYWKDSFVDLTIETPSGQTYYALDNAARFFIRYSLVESDSIWQITEWYDLGERQ